MKRLKENRPVCALLIVEAALYIAFLAADLFFGGWGIVSSILKYAGILLCVVIAALLRRNSWDRQDSIYLLCALVFTCAADLFLLLLNKPVYGIVLFCMAHLLYIRRYRAAWFTPAAYITLSAIAVCLAAGSFTTAFPLRNALAMLYGVLLVSVFILAGTSPLPRINRRLVMTGMALFLLCDIHVALFNILSASHPYYPFAAFFMWFFYLPSQVLLAVSEYAYAD